MNLIEWLMSVNWLPWITAIAAVIAAFASLQAWRDKRTPPLGTVEEQLLTEIVDHEEPLGENLHPEDTRFMAIERLGEPHAVQQGSGEARIISPNAFANLRAVGMIARTDQGFYYVTLAGRAYVDRQRRRQRWRFWNR